MCPSTVRSSSSYNSCQGDHVELADGIIGVQMLWQELSGSLGCNIVDVSRVRCVLSCIVGLRYVTGVSSGAEVLGMVFIDKLRFYVVRLCCSLDLLSTQEVRHRTTYVASCPVC